MSIPIPAAQKPIQLYLWSKCGFCTKQMQLLYSMDAEMQEWFNRSVTVTTVDDPKKFPTVKGYPFWVLSGRPSPGFKTMAEIVSMRHITP